MLWTMRLYTQPKPSWISSKRAGLVFLANENNGSTHKSSHGVSNLCTYVRRTRPVPAINGTNLAFANNAKWGEALKSLGKGDMEASRIDDSRRMP